MPYKYPLMRSNFCPEDMELIVEHLRSDDPFLTNGKNCLEFERQWSEWLGVKYSVFVNSGTAANILSMDILRMAHPQGGEVIVPPLTWVSDIVSVLRSGFKPVFADINLRTLSMDTSEIIKKITDKTRAIFMTHAQGFHGLSDELLRVIDEKDILLIEDVCESHGCTYKKRKVGTFGIISNFSFYYAHHMSTIEGGMVCTDSHELYQKLRMLRSHGMVREMTCPDTRSAIIRDNQHLNPEFIFAVPGYNFRNTEIGGILGLSQLKRLDKNIEARTKNLKRFLAGLDTNLYQTEFDVEGSSSYAFNLVLKEKNEELMSDLCEQLLNHSIEFRRGSAGGGNQLRQPYLRDFVGAEEWLQYPNTEHVHFYGLYIGNFPNLTDHEIDYILDVINSVSR